VGYGRAINGIFPGVGLSPSMCGIVAMSGLFGSAARAPLTSFLFAFELTGNAHAIVPLMVGCMAADLTARALMSESVMTERLARRGLRISQDLEANQFATLPVRLVMRPPVAALSARMTLADALRLLAGAPTLTPVGVAAPGVTGQNGHAPPHATSDETGGAADGGSVVTWRRQQWTFPITDEDGALVGIVSRGELLDAAEDPAHLTQPVSAFATRDPQVTTPEEALGDALERLAIGDFAMLPVVSDDGSRRIVGAISRSDAVRARGIVSERQARRVRYFGGRPKAAQPS
jgi:CBS domain-containing protein